MENEYLEILDRESKERRYSVYRFCGDFGKYFSLFIGGMGVIRMPENPTLRDFMPVLVGAFGMACSDMIQRLSNIIEKEKPINNLERIASFDPGTEIKKRQAE